MVPGMDLSKYDVEKKVAMHTAMMCFWIFAAVIVVICPERFNWVFVVAALVYLALDELVNVLFWRKYDCEKGSRAP